MTATTHVPVFETTLRKTHEWLDELTSAGICADHSQAYSVLRAVLHALRDRLIPDEAIDLGAQLPMLVRGFYFEGWKPSKTPTRQRSRQAFLHDVQEEIANIEAVNAERAVKAVFGLLGRHVSYGEIEDVARMLPEEVRDLWPPVNAQRR